MKENIKEKLSIAIKSMLETKPLSKITVKEISEVCNINRQSFYYYFSDIYELAFDVFSSEVNKIIFNINSTNDMLLTYTSLFNYLMDNRKVFLNAITNISEESINFYLGKILKEIFGEFIKKREKFLNVCLKEDNRNELINFYSFYISKELIIWFRSGENFIPLNKAKIIYNLIHSTFDENIIMLSKIWTFYFIFI